ncbi:MAG: hypothetical protein MAG431_01445 [Chloroflexi bacterium]|nr:hypothetical protein [Chloroflexota bacterium]
MGVAGSHETGVEFFSHFDEFFIYLSQFGDFMLLEFQEETVAPKDIEVPGHFLACLF